MLGLKDLILYGIILIMPIAPVPLYGLAQKLSDGQAVTTILLAMAAIMLTAFSYGRMAAKFPAAGPAYTYVGRGLNPHLGFLAGWAMILDDLLVPLICTIYGALTIQRLVPSVPYAVWAAILAGSMTVINLRVSGQPQMRPDPDDLDDGGDPGIYWFGHSMALPYARLAGTFLHPAVL